jgi:hypothetical protein
MNAVVMEERRSSPAMPSAPDALTHHSRRFGHHDLHAHAVRTVYVDPTEVLRSE